MGCPVLYGSGVPGVTRTPDPQFRKQLLDATRGAASRASVLLFACESSITRNAYEHNVMKRAALICLWAHLWDKWNEIP
jgi:hypothetical protein